MTEAPTSTPTLILTLAQTLAETTQSLADRQVAAKLMEDFPNIPNTRNCDILLTLAGMIAAQGAHAAADNGVPRGIGISIVAGAVSILAQLIGEEMTEPPPSTTH